MYNTQTYMDFINGELDYNAEQKFAEQFATDESFRSDFKCYLSIIQGINKNIKKFAPSSQVTGSIFSQLGITLPHSANFCATAAKGAFLKGKFFVGLTSGIASAAASIILMISIFNTGNIISKNDDVQITSGNKISSAQIPLNQSKELEKRTGVHVKPDIKYIYFEKNKADGVREIPTVQNTANNEEETNLQFKDEKIISSLANPQILSQTFYGSEQIDKMNLIHPITVAQLMNVRTVTREKLGFNIAFRGSANWNLPEETIYPSEIAKFNNMGLLIFYPISKYFSIGADLRQETFSTRYKGIDTLKQTFKYEQQPNLFTTGFNLRFIPHNFYNISPYTQVNFGLNKYGIIARGAAGAEYYIYPDLAITTDIEYSLLFFNHQKNWFTTKKISFNYGIVFKF